MQRLHIDVGAGNVYKYEEAMVLLREAEEERAEAEERRKAALGSLFKTLLHHLMTGKVRVGEVAVSTSSEVE